MSTYTHVYSLSSAIHPVKIAANVQAHIYARYLGWFRVVEVQYERTGLYSLYQDNNGDFIIHKTTITKADETAWELFRVNLSAVIELVSKGQLGETVP